jgi:photosystem II stability/assembly factor-like uncharacterized protein
MLSFENSMSKNIFIGIFIISSGIAQAQFKNIKLDQGDPNNRAAEPSIAVNITNPLNIVAASAQNNVYQTTDGGVTWKKSALSSSLGVLGNPHVLSDFKGNFFYFHLSDPTGKNGDSEEVLDRIVVQESNDGGSNWNEGVSIGLNPPKDQNKERAIADRKGNMYVTWTQFDNYESNEKGCQSNILLSTSSNGKKWSKPVTISQNAGDCKNDDNTTEGAMATASADGSRVFIAWAHQNKILFDRSFDSGKTWLMNDIEIADQPGGWAMNIPGIKKCNGLPVLVSDNTKKGKMSGALYLVWADQHNGENDTDIWFIRSMNFGDNWTQPLRINNDGKGKHQFLPWMTVDPSNGHIYILYYDRRAHDDLQTDVYLAYSTDSGASFKNVKISETPFTPNAEISFGDYINISASQGIITPIWTRVDNGQTSVWTAIIKQEELEKVK